MIRALLAVFAWAATSVAGAHEVRPGLLQITEQDAHHYTVLWKQPVNGDVAVHLIPRLSGGALDGPADVASVSPSYALKLWRNISDARAPLDGQTISVEGLEHSITDVLVSVTLRDGRSVQQFLKPQNRSALLDLREHAAPPIADYLLLGIEHILTGVDHLLFVFGLLLLVGKSWALLKTISAFTVAHSVALVATALGWIQVRASLVEALVALSIVVLAVELVRYRRGEAGLTSRYPWLIAFAFGLLHGCAFAGALAEVGLPPQHIPCALFLFNLGVETGQLVFIAGASLVMWAVARLANGTLSWTRHSWPRLVAPSMRLVVASAGLAIPYVIGVFAAYWFIERFVFAINSNQVRIT